MRLFALAFVAGALALQQQATLPSSGVLAALFISIISILCVSFFLNKTKSYKPYTSAIGCLLLGVLLGFSWAALRAHHRLNDALPKAWESKPIVITGVVTSLPQRFSYGERFIFTTESVATEGAIVPRRILLSQYPEKRFAQEIEKTRAPYRVHPAERWQFTVRLKRPHGLMNPQGFDYEAWLFERDIRATGQVVRGAPQEKISPQVIKPQYLIERLRDQLRERFDRAMNDAPYLGILIALTLGDQQSIPKAQWEIFAATGVTHLMSISGLHITMLGSLFSFLCFHLWRQSTRLMLFMPAQKAALLAGLWGAFLYTLLAGFGIPAQRTLYMLATVVACLYTARHFNATRILILSLFIVVLIDPWAVNAIGFWLSFGAVALLMFAGGAALSASVNQKARIMRWGSAQWGITLGSLPLLLFFFQQFSLISPLANLIAIPLVSFIITPLALLFALTGIPALLLVDHWILSVLMDGLHWLSAFPLWRQATPPIWMLILATLGILWILLPRGLPARWVGGLLLLPALTFTASRPEEGSAWVDVLDVGQGLSVLIRTQKHTLLYDTGPQYSPESFAADRVVLPYLRSIGVNKLDKLLISHRDKDHASGLESLQSALPIDDLVSSASFAKSRPCLAGETWQWDSIRFTILHPTPSQYERPIQNSNHLSCVLRIETPQYRLLLTGDIAAKEELAILEHFGDLLPADILLAPHHGGKASSSPAFIARVNADHVIFSVGYQNPFGHPSAQVIERYKSHKDTSFWHTDRDGALQMRLNDTLDIQATRKTAPRYWHDSESRVE